MIRRDIDPDVTRSSDASYWAAAWILAHQAGDVDRQNLARDRLNRLGYRVVRHAPKRGEVAK